MKLIIDIPEVVQHKVYAYGLSLSPSDKEQLIKAILNGTPIPDNATNGEIMQMMFSNGATENFATFMSFAASEDEYINCTYEWWNAPYKTESENKE